MTRVAPGAVVSRVLAFDTSTEEAAVALGSADGAAIAHDRWPTGHLHGERLLASIEETLRMAGTTLEGLTAIVVGLGPGSFTGLRVGLASAKGLAFGLGIPVVGIATPLALCAAVASAGEEGGPSRLTVVLSPAGPNGRYRTVVRHGRGGALLLAAPPAYEPVEADPAIPAGARVIAVDLPAAPRHARVAGARARRALGAALLRLGAARLAAGGHDDLAELVPLYATLPRGAAATGGRIAWSLGRP